MPSPPEVNQPATLNHVFFHAIEAHSLERALSWGRGAQAEYWSTEAFAGAVFGLRRWLLAAGLEAGDRVAVISENRPEWTITDFALMLAGMVVAPVYPTLSPEQTEHLIAHSGARAVLFSGPAQWERLAPIFGRLREVRWLLSMDPAPDTELIALDRVFREAAGTDAAERAAIRAEALALDPATIATIVYTSGTTGTPKGVMLSHGNVAFDLAASLERLPDRKARQALSVLPLSHVFERVLVYGYVLRGVPVAFGDPYSLKELLREHRPELMGCVPRALEKIREAIESQVALLPGWKQKMSRFLLSVGAARVSGKGGSRAALFPLADLLMFRKVKRQLGDLQSIICGGAWLDPKLEEFFRALGFDLLQGYGLTETSPVITFNPLARPKIGSVGPAIAGVEVKISEDGEILTRGPHVMQGYYHDPEATARAFRDGWFLTGDLGRLDTDGYLTITGRRKEMLVLSNGKNIFYAPIEQALSASPYIEHAYVVGEGRNYAALLIIPRREAVLRLAEERAILLGHEAELLLAGPVLEMFQGELDRHQAAFSRFERVKRFSFLSAEALLDPELVTPTQKVRRSVLERKYASWIARIYQQEKPFLIPPPETQTGAPAGARAEERGSR